MLAALCVLDFSPKGFVIDIYKSLRLGLAKGMLTVSELGLLEVLAVDRPLEGSLHWHSRRQARWISTLHVQPGGLRFP